MQIIDLDTWPRKQHFEFFNRMDYPHINICTELEVTKAVEWIRDHQFSVFKSMLYLITRCANQVEALRLRIRTSTVVLHDKVHPSFTVLTDDKTFGFAHMEFCESLDLFFKNAEQVINEIKQKATLKDEHGRDDYLFLSCLPWIHFTSVSHPVNIQHIDSVPRITWGRITEKQNQVSMPVSVQVHHALADGIHLAAYLDILQSCFSNPEDAFR